MDFACAGIARPKICTAFDCSLGSPLALALVFAGIPRRIGYDYKGRGRWLTDKIPLKGYEGRPVAAYYLDLLSFATGSQVPAGAADILEVRPEDKRWRDAYFLQQKLTPKKYIVIHPGGGASWGKSAGLKRWQPENFVELADKTFEKGACPIILLGDGSEMLLCSQIAAAMKYRPLILAGQADIMQAAALMQAAKLVIVNDGGPLHVAAAFGAATVSIFGPVDPVVYGAYPREGHRVIQKGLPCQPCYRNFRMSDCTHQSCLKELSVDEVFNEIMEMI